MSYDMGYLQALVCFGIVKNLTVNISLRTTYTDKCIRGIFPMERKIVPEPLAPVVILEKGTEDNVTAILSL